MSLEQEIFGQYEKPLFEPVKVFGRDLLCKAFSGEDFGWCQKACLEKDPDDEDKQRTDNCLLKAAVTVVSLYDQNHQRVFPFTNLQELKAKVARVAATILEAELSKVYKVTAPMSALEESALEDAEKNSETTPASYGGTESPES